MGSIRTWWRNALRCVSESIVIFRFWSQVFHIFSQKNTSKSIRMTSSMLSRLANTTGNHIPKLPPKSWKPLHRSFASRCSSWNRKMFKGARKPRSSAPHTFGDGSKPGSPQLSQFEVKTTMPVWRKQFWPTLKTVSNLNQTARINNAEHHIVSHIYIYIYI